MTYQAYLYGNEYEDVKYLLTENFDVKGVFSTKNKAEDYIKQDLQEEAEGMCGDDIKEVKEFINEYKDHYDIYKFELDKSQQ